MEKRHGKEQTEKNLSERKRDIADRDESFARLYEAGNKSLMSSEFMKVITVRSGLCIMTNSASNTKLLAG